MQFEKKSIDLIIQLSHELNELVLLIPSTTAFQIETSQSVFSLMEQITQISLPTDDFHSHLSNCIEKC